jgi:transcriptional regulator with XRE-family HTH domain
MNEHQPTPNPESSLARYAAHLASDDEFMASILRQYREQETLTESAMANRLGISSEMYVRLAMCQRPVSDAARFAEQVRQIAAYVGCDAVQLAQIVRQVEALASIEPNADAQTIDAPTPSARTAGLGLLTAARDRTDGDGVSDLPSDGSETSDTADSE